VEEDGVSFAPKAVLQLSSLDRKKVDGRTALMLADRRLFLGGHSRRPSWRWGHNPGLSRVVTGATLRRCDGSSRTAIGLTESSLDDVIPRSSSSSSSTSAHVWNDVVDVKSPALNTDRTPVTTSTIDWDRATSGENSTSGLASRSVGSRSSRPGLDEPSRAESGRRCERRRGRRHDTVGTDRVRDSGFLESGWYNYGAKLPRERLVQTSMVRRFMENCWYIDQMKYGATVCREQLVQHQG